MPELNWTQSAPLHNVAGQRRHGVTEGEAGVTIGEVRSFQLLLLFARRGQASTMRKKAKSQFGQEPGDKPTAIAARDDSLLIWTGPDQFCVLQPAAGATKLDELRSAFAATASISDQSGSRSLIRITGPRMRDCLAKMVSIDLHPDIFHPGDAAATRMGHIAVNIWRDGDDSFNILVFASFAEALWRAILDHGAEYGVEIVEPVALGRSGSFA